MGENQDPQHLELLPYQIEIRNSTSGEGRSGTAAALCGWVPPADWAPVDRMRRGCFIMYGPRRAGKSNALDTLRAFDEGR